MTTSFKKGMVLGIVLLMIGTVFSGLVNTVRADDEKLIISVTDISPWFSKGSNSGHPEYWHSYTHDGHSYIWTYVGGMSEEPSQPDCWAEFRPYLTQDGEYDVYACFYADPQNSHIVPHTVYYDGGSTTILVDQYALNYYTWREVKLGTWNFKAGADTYVVVTDATGESYDGHTTLNVDTIKFASTSADDVLPTVDAFSVSPLLVTLGSTFTIAYVVSDEGGSGLKQVELWRKSTGDWEQIEETSLAGIDNGPYSDYFYDAPPLVGTYWYGLHVVDNAGNWAPEGSPIGVEVTPETYPPDPPILMSPGSIFYPGLEIDILTPIFNWNSVSNADYYGLYIRDLDLDVLVFDSELDYGPIHGTSFELPYGILEDGKHYRWNMRAYNSEGWGDFSSRLYFYTFILDEDINGIDVSEYQENINWFEVYDSGYVFAFSKATAGDHRPPQYIDPYFEINMMEGREAGMLMGAYHYAYPQYNNPVDEALFFIDIAGAYIESGYLRPALDLEEGSGDLSKEELSNWVHEWMSTVESVTGIQPILYVNSYYANNYLDSSVTEYDLWIAHWTYNPDMYPDTGIWDNWDFWQYSDEGFVPGINGHVDLDIFNGDMSRLNAFIIGHPLDNPPYDPSTPDPCDGESGVPVYTDLSCYIYDPDGDTIDVYFYWSDGTLIDVNYNVPSGTRASVYPQAALDVSTAYQWYVIADDGTYTTLSETWMFSTTMTGVLDVDPLEISDITSISAKLNAICFSTLPTDASFYYGLTDDINDAIETEPQQVHYGETFSQIITNLNPGTTYHWWVYGEQWGGGGWVDLEYGGTFTTNQATSDNPIAPGTLEGGSSERKLARTSDGALHCVYFRLEGSYHQIYYSYSTDEGESWTEEPVTTGAQDYRHPCIAVDKDDNIHVAWSLWHGSVGPGWYGTIQYRVKTTSWQGIDDVITGYYDYPSLAIDSEDVVHLAVGGYSGGAYHCARVQYLKKSMPSSDWSTPYPVSSSCWATLPELIVDKDDNIHVLYAHAPSYGPHYGLRYHQKVGGVWQGEEIVQADDEHWSCGSMALDSIGNVYVVCSNQGTGCIKIRRRTSSGWQTADDVYGADGYSQRYPVISIDKNDYIHVVWSGKHEGSPNHYQIRYRKYTTDWSSVQNITSASVDQEHPNLIWAWHPVVDGV